MALPGATRKRGGSWSTPVLLLSFGLVLLILFNRDLQLGLGRVAGYALDPVIGFGGHYPILTILLASVLLVVLTTVIRHFLVDWTSMARTQEAMRSFQKEFMEARKSNNTYKLKKLTEAQPQVFELQAAVQKDQFKPMIATMILVIPLFAWLGSTLATPVDFALADGPATPVAMAVTIHAGVQDGFVASDGLEGRHALNAGADSYMYALRAPGDPPMQGDVVIRNTRTGDTFGAPLAPAPEIPAAARVGRLEAGSYTFSVPAPADNLTLHMTGDFGPYDVASVLLVFMEDGRIVGAAPAHRSGQPFTLDRAADVYAVVPDGLPGGTNEGRTRVDVSGDAATSWEVTPANVVEIDRTFAAPVHPYNGATPWEPEAWSLQHPDGWFGILPHWIVLYSLFGIPFGQLAQRALKLWEYRKVDLDDDGRPAGGA